MLLPPTSHDSRSSRRFGRQRRHLGKLARVAFLLGSLCVVVSLAFFISSRLEKKKTAHKQLVTSAGFLVAAPLLLGLGLGLGWWKHRFYGRGRRSRSNTNGSRSAADEDGPAAGQGRSGSTLVMALILTAVIAGVVLQVQWRARRELAGTQHALTQTTLHQAAAEAIRVALQRLAADDDITVDHERKAWAIPQLTTNPAGIVVGIRITDENRSFDWNNLAIPPVGPQSRSASDIAMDLMNLGGDYAPLDRLAALTDWLDEDSRGLWETPFYRQQIPPYEAANRPLYTWGELFFVHGFSRDFFRPRKTDNVFAHTASALLDSFTVVPVARERPVRVNINTAGREVLLAVLGVDQGYAVQALLALREGGPIRSLRPIQRAVDPNLQDVVERYFDIRSLFFRIEAEAMADGQSTRIRAIARRDESSAIEIVQWLF
ncbi:MAG: hypothetical protein EPN23_00395 [Verrucomicrobia bacterium]|nr:MAG: hypothetical protein EPN23_00395 [Verrucomicrobiota bacterium]